MAAAERPFFTERRDMDMMPILPETELEAMAAQHLGRLLFVFGRLEMNLGLALVRLRPVGESGVETVRVDKLSFGEKLTECEAAALLRHADNGQALARWMAWFAAAHALRKLRNDFARGRWGFQNMQEQIVHVSNLPDSPNQEVARYTLDEFAARVAEAEELSEKFYTLTRVHPVDPCHKLVTQVP
jgi:hypothetical protein